MLEAIIHLSWNHQFTLKMTMLHMLILLVGVVIGSVNGVATKEATFYELKQGNLTVKFSDLGARVVSLSYPDKNGKLADVVLGYDTINEYKKDIHNFNAIVGRYTNIIKGAQFNYNGTNYKLTPNDGKNTLNGGHRGYGFAIWKVANQKTKKDSSHISFTYNSFDGEEGFPGNLTVTVKYTLKPKKLITVLHAEALNKPTPVNLGQHMGFNLAGHSSGDILSHEIQIFGSKYIEKQKNFLPTGKILPVENTPYDFLKPHIIGNQIKKLKEGYETNYILDQGGPGLKLAAIFHEKNSGRIVKVWTTQPTMLFTTINDIDVKGKGGYLYKPHAGCTLDPQGYTDSINHPNFPTEFVAKGKPYHHRSVYEFSVRS